MQIRTEDTNIPGATLVIPEVFEDNRGFFTEVFRADQYREHGLPSDFVQFNHSGSVKNTVRGLHFQWDPPMGKLMRVTHGTAFLVAVDIRVGSSSLGQWYGDVFDSKNRRLLWAEAGFARGFAVLSDYAEIQYLTTGIYNSNAESGILWNDPEIGIDWPVAAPIMTDKDRKAQPLSQWLQRPEARHFSYVDQGNNNISD